MSTTISTPTGAMNAAVTSRQDLELLVLRRVAQGTVRRGVSDDEFYHDGAAVPSEWVPALIGCVLNRCIAFTADAYPSGVALRAELTVAGFHRVAALQALRLRH